MIDVYGLAIVHMQQGFRAAGQGEVFVAQPPRPSASRRAPGWAWHAFTNAMIAARPHHPEASEPRPALHVSPCCW